MRALGAAIVAGALSTIGRADVEIGGDYTFADQATVTFELLMNGDVVGSSSAVVDITGTARTIVQLSQRPTVFSDLFGTDIVTGRVEALELTATDAPLSMMGITINLRNMRGRFGDCSGAPGTIDVTDQGNGRAFLDQIHGLMELEGDLEISGGVEPLAFNVSANLADGGPQIASIFAEYELSFVNGQLTQALGVFDGGGVLQGGFVTDGVEVRISFSLAQQLDGTSPITRTHTQCCADAVPQGAFHDSGGTAEIPLGFGLAAPAIADFNGDGRNDIAISNSVDQRVYLLFSTGPLTFAPPAEIDVAVDDLTAIDLDGDGDQDLVGLNNELAGITVLLNNGDGTFGAATNFPVANFPIAIDFGDLDSDGDPDAVVICDRFAAPNIFVLRNDGSGAFGPAEGFQSNSGPRDIALGDIDNDGDIDMVIPLRSADFVAFRRNDGTGVFTNLVGFNISASGADGPVAVALFDFDGDNDLDVVVANEFSDNVTGVRNNNGLFTSGSIATFSLGGVDRPFKVTVGDFDGDDDRDIAVGYRGFDSPPGGVVTLRNNGAGLFENPINHPMFESTVTDLDAADFDQDGDLDLLTTNDTFAFEPDHVTLLNNGCVGTFEPTPCPGDVDGDRDIDLSDLATLLANFGSASGQTRENGDLNGDGDVDLSDLAELLAAFGGSCP